MRPRPLITALLALTILIGLASRQTAQHLPRLLAKDLGDALWPVMFYLIVLLLNPRASPLVAALTALTLACASEFAKRIHTPALHALRAHPIPGLLLGRVFLWTNFIAYFVGTCAAATIDHVIFRRPQMRVGSVPKFEHGHFCVLIVSAVHPTILYTEAGSVESAIDIEGKRTKTAIRVIQQYGGQIVQNYGSPLTVLWPCEKGAPDPHALVAALAIAGALANPESAPRDDPLAAHWGLTIGAACELALFQRDRETFINVLGPAVTRAAELHDLAETRGVTLTIDANLANLKSPVQWQQITDSAWSIPQ